MITSISKNFYQGVPREQWELLIRFRATHLPRQLELGGVRWKYLTGGQKAAALLLLPGAIGRGEAAFRHILELEDDYRLIVPDYPLIPTVDRLLSGLVSLLNSEGIKSVALIGGSMGGGLAQCMVRKYPERINKLVLSHTGVPNPQRAKMSDFGMKVMRFLPIGLIRAALRWEVSKLLSNAGSEKQFWLVYFKELIAGLTKDEVVRGYNLAVDLNRNYGFAPSDLAEWPGRILILESDNDSIIPASERAALKALYPQAQVHTFIGAGHGASVIRREEYISVIRTFLRT